MVFKIDSGMRNHRHGIGMIRCYPIPNSRINKNGSKSKPFKVDLEPSEIQDMYSEMDADGSGNLDFDEFLLALRPPMSRARKSLIQQAFR